MITFAITRWAVTRATIHEQIRILNAYHHLDGKQGKQVEVIVATVAGPYFWCDGAIEYGALGCAMLAIAHFFVKRPLPKADGNQ